MTQKHNIILQPSGRRGQVEEGQCVRFAARDLGVHIESICAENGTCGKCIVLIEEGRFEKYNIDSRRENVSPVTQAEAAYLKHRLNLLKGKGWEIGQVRLSCQCRIQGDVLINVPEVAISGGEKTLLVAISRSGETSETLAAVPVFREQTGGQVLVITCDGQSSQAKHADFVLAAETAQEQSVAQTHSFSSMALLTQALAAQVAGYPAIQALTPLARIVERVIHKYQESIRHLAETTSIENFFFLGAGTLYGIACEAMLKIKEMSITHSEAYHFLEFRHGPKALVDQNTMVVGMIGSEHFRHEAAVITEMAEMGGKTVVLAPGKANAGHVTVHPRGERGPSLDLKALVDAGRAAFRTRRRISFRLDSRART